MDKAGGSLTAKEAKPNHVSNGSVGEGEVPNRKRSAERRLLHACALTDVNAGQPRQGELTVQLPSAVSSQYAFNATSTRY